MRRLLAVATVAVALGGCLGVDAVDGTLACSAVAGRPCPAGYYCLQPDDTCWRYGHYPDDMARPYAVIPPGGGDDLSVPVELDMSLPTGDGSATD